MESSPDGFSTAAPSITLASGLAVARLPELFILSDDFFRSAICHSSLKKLAKFYIIDFPFSGSYLTLWLGNMLVDLKL